LLFGRSARVVPVIAMATVEAAGDPVSFSPQPSCDLNVI
jgi:hypothetical protein